MKNLKLIVFGSLVTCLLLMLFLLLSNIFKKGTIYEFEKNDTYEAELLKLESRLSTISQKELTSKDRQCLNDLIAAKEVSKESYVKETITSKEFFEIQYGKLNDKKILMGYYLSIINTCEMDKDTKDRAINEMMTSYSIKETMHMNEAYKHELRLFDANTYFLYESGNVNQFLYNTEYTGAMILEMQLLSRILELMEARYEEVN